MSEIVTAIIISALGSSLVTALAFVTSFNGKLSSIRGDVKAMAANMAELKTDVRALRDSYSEVSQSIGRQDERLKSLEKKQEDKQYAS